MDKSDYEALAAFRYALRQFLRTSELRARSIGVTAQQYQAMLAIKGFPGRAEANIGEIAERLQSEHHSTVELIDRLEANGLVQRRSDQDNRRRVVVFLTRQGEEALERVATDNRQELCALAPEIISTLQCLIHNKEYTDDADEAETGST